MEFLKDVLGDLYEAAAERIESYNNDNPEKPLELVNLSDGNYISKENYENTVSAIKKENAVDLALTRSGAKNIIAAKALMRLDEIGFENGNATGVDEQISKLKRENSFLFEAEKSGGAMHGSGEVISSDENFIRDIWENQVKR